MRRAALCCWECFLRHGGSPAFVRADETGAVPGRALSRYGTFMTCITAGTSSAPESRRGKKGGELYGRRTARAKHGLRRLPFIRDAAFSLERGSARGATCWCVTGTNAALLLRDDSSSFGQRRTAWCLRRHGNAGRSLLRWFSGREASSTCQRFSTQGPASLRIGVTRTTAGRLYAIRPFSASRAIRNALTVKYGLLLAAVAWRDVRPCAELGIR